MLYGLVIFKTTVIMVLIIINMRKELTVVVEWLERLQQFWCARK